MAEKVLRDKNEPQSLGVITARHSDAKLASDCVLSIVPLARTERKTCWICNRTFKGHDLDLGVVAIDGKFECRECYRDMLFGPDRGNELDY